MGFFRRWETSSNGSDDTEKTGKRHDSGAPTEDEVEQQQVKQPKWSLGILNDKDTDEVPGSILLLSKVNKRNEPLGLRHAPARTSSSSLPSPYPPELHRSRSASSVASRRKTTNDGQIVLDPQPEDSSNDPLNLPVWRRNAALLSLGFYCLLGGGMTPILAAGFNNVAQTYNTTVPRVALTTGLYMMGLGVGSVIMSPTAILFGKRPVYLATAILFIVTSVWCALSPSYNSLLVARIFQGISVSPVECLPSASIAEIFFLHERAYRLGIYTLLLLGGKNLIPLVSAVIIQALDWRWVFWVIAIVVAFGAILLFFFVPETFWDRTPRPRHRAMHKPHNQSQASGLHDNGHWPHASNHRQESKASLPTTTAPAKVVEIAPRESTTQESVYVPSAASTTMTLTLPVRKKKSAKVAFNEPEQTTSEQSEPAQVDAEAKNVEAKDFGEKAKARPISMTITSPAFTPASPSDWQRPSDWAVLTPHPTNTHAHMPTPELRNLNSPFYASKMEEIDYFSIGVNDAPDADPAPEAAGNIGAPRATPKLARSAGLLTPQLESALRARRAPVIESPPETPQSSPAPPSAGAAPCPVSQVEKTSVEHSQNVETSSITTKRPAHIPHTEWYRTAPARSYFQTLRPYHGRLSHDNWFRVAARPFILFCYPAVFWSALIYALSVGWLIVLSESVSTVYKNRASYNFTSLQVGLVYLSPFIGGILGTAVAGKVSDVIVRWMSRRNDGVYEPEFRLVMALPVAISTTIGLMGFGWSAEERDAWIVPTFFFGVISFGCTLGSTTAITFCVDSYRQYAGEALVTLNFSKNIFHGLVFSLFFTHWLEADGSKTVFLALGGIQIACCLLSIPMYIYGKRARMWTVRRNLMEKF